MTCRTIIREAYFCLDCRCIHPTVTIHVHIDGPEVTSDNERLAATGEVQEHGP